MDANRFPDLIRQHAGLIHKIAYAYCRNAADREDVVQEVAVQLWRSMGRYDGRGRITTWIYRIAFNVAISFYRRERRHRDRQKPLEEHLLAVPAVEADPAEDVQFLMRCIDDLDEVDRALVLLYLDGNDHATTAEVLGITASNVGTRIHRIKERLRAAFARQGQLDQETPDATR